MCGILGIATGQTRALSINRQVAARLRDRLDHRGPDGMGLWSEQHIVLAHRRLAIRGGTHGIQPWHVATPGHPTHGVLVYDGELYNGDALRHELERSHRCRFRTICDTEVVAQALRCWGPEALERFRGMFALGWYDAHRHELILARDSMGIKPLHFAEIAVPGGHELIFASEIPAILDHPHMSAAPDWATVNAYLSTIRTTLGQRTMYEGIRMLPPGMMLRCDLRPARPAWRIEPYARAYHDEPVIDEHDAQAQTREIITESVNAHLVSDGPVSLLLSGGLDSAIVARLATSDHASMRSYCGGADDVPDGDRAHAAALAETLGTTHTEVNVNEQAFCDTWSMLVRDLGRPLSTPNEVAIYHLGAAIKPHAKVVLSGEGADEIFGGYDLVMRRFTELMQRGRDGVGRRMTPARAWLQTISWTASTATGTLLNRSAPDMRALGRILTDELDAVFSPVDPAASILRQCLYAQQRLNLTGLLERLDGALMRSGVEGRVPFSDVVVARFANALPVDLHYHLPAPENADAVVARLGQRGMSTSPRRGETKRLLRRAFSDVLPPTIVNRSKMSFPLPFTEWLAGVDRSVWQHPMVRETFAAHAIDAIRDQPGQHWTIAWPMLNIALWLQHQWGTNALRIAA